MTFINKALCCFLLIVCLSIQNPLGSVVVSAADENVPIEEYESSTLGNFWVWLKSKWPLYKLPSVKEREKYLYPIYDQEIYLPPNNNRSLRDLAIRLHERIREEAGVKRSKLIWSRALERDSTIWSQMCENRYYRLADSRKYRYGQNIFPTSADQADIRAAVDKWKSFSENYNKAGGRCYTGKNCYPYMQMIWPKVQKIGCGWSKCKDIAKTGKSGSVLVCFYSPLY